MSQQTQMATLVPYFHRFVEKFPDVRVLARASEDEVLSAWTGLGYYSRARNIRAAAIHIVRERSGEFPKTIEGWLDLPGVGPYTAAAIASQCFGVREPVWDGNVLRVTSRLSAAPASAEDAHGSKFRTAMTAALRCLISGRNPSAFNQALMELGAMVCTPRAPACGRCPLAKACRAHQRGSVDKFPPPKPRKAAVELRPKVWVEVRRGRAGPEAFLVPRPSGSWFPGMWDFPSQLGGAAKPVSGAPPAPRGFLRFCEARHTITHHKIRLEGWLRLVPKPASTAPAKVTPAGRWIPLTELTSQTPPVPLATTARKILRPLMAYLEPLPHLGD